MISDTLLPAGIAMGFSIAMPVGPMALLCIQRTLASGMRAGLWTGLGAATVNVIHALVVLSSLHSLAPVLRQNQEIFGVLTGVFLLCAAARTLMRQVSEAGQADPAASRPMMTYLSAVAFNATNPMSVMLVVALLSPVADDALASPGAGMALLCGMFMAATCWWACLSGVVSLLRGRLRPAWIQHLNQLAGMLLTAYGTLALARY
jgi:threonine/homoserine/homoserine lactone efflux protein